MSRLKAPSATQPGWRDSGVAQCRWSVDLGEHVHGLEWLGMGRGKTPQIAAMPSVGATRIFDAKEGTFARALPEHRDGNSGISVSHPLGRIATGGHDGLVYVCDSESGQTIHILEAGKGWCGQIAFSPDGALLATTVGRVLRVWNAAGQVVFESRAHESTVAALEWRPDSQGVATGAYNGVRLFRSRHGRWEPDSYEYLLWKGSIISLAWSRNGRYVAAGSQENTIQFWRLPYRPGDELFMSGYASKVNVLAWDRRNQFLASGGGEIVTVWDVSGRGPAGTRPLQLEAHTARITALSFQQGGDVLASGGADGQLVLWDFVKKRRHLVSLESGSISSVAWAPDGRAIAVGTSSGNLFIYDVTFEGS